MNPAQACCTGLVRVLQQANARMIVHVRLDMTFNSAGSGTCNGSFLLHFCSGGFKLLRQLQQDPMLICE